MSTPIAPPYSRVAVLGLVVAVVAVLMVACAGPFYRINLASLDEALELIRWGAWLGGAAVVIALVGAWRSQRSGSHRSLVLALVAAALGAVAVGIPFAMLQSAKRSTTAHVTTETVNPRCVAIVTLRNGAPHSVDDAGKG